MGITSMKKHRIAVAMSGGIDSSVAAALLKAEGHDVVGVTMILSDEDESPSHYVTEAKRIADILNMDHYTLDLRSEFYELVVKGFCEAYHLGETPNPCVYCNQSIKFGALLNWTKAINAELIATGHYAIVHKDDVSQRFMISKGRDKFKDQSYVLWRLTQEQLSRVVLPLGLLHKKQVKELALQFGLHLHNQAESQDICFIKGENYRTFLHRTTGVSECPGDMIDHRGFKVGTHEGISYYTVGQRKGLGIALGYPAYVIDIDPIQNIVYVGPKSSAYRQDVCIKKGNWVSIEEPQKPINVYAKVRYNMNPAPGLMMPDSRGGYCLIFDDPQWAITPGQSMVMYDGDRLLGGGIITRDRVQD
jgi:tRNA-specific 2-thiouridylase